MPYEIKNFTQIGKFYLYFPRIDEIKEQTAKSFLNEGLSIYDFKSYYKIARGGVTLYLSSLKLNGIVGGALLAYLKDLISESEKEANKIIKKRAPSC